MIRMYSTNNAFSYTYIFKFKDSIVLQYYFHRIPMPLSAKTAIYATSVCNYLHNLMFFDSSVKSTQVRSV